jgi:hypothetical protein
VGAFVCLFVCLFGLFVCLFVCLFVRLFDRHQFGFFVAPARAQPLWRALCKVGVAGSKTEKRFKL